MDGKEIKARFERGAERFPEVWERRFRGKEDGVWGRRGGEGVTRV